MSNTIAANETNLEVQVAKAEVSVSTTNFLLTSQDRCDLCGAQAYFQVNFGAHGLTFCAHHYKEKESKLLSSATSIRDESAQLQK